MERKTLTVKGIAGYLRVHTDMIYTLVREKQIPHVRLEKPCFIYDGVTS